FLRSKVFRLSCTLVRAQVRPKEYVQDFMNICANTRFLTTSSKHTVMDTRSLIRLCLPTAQYQHPQTSRPFAMSLSLWKLLYVAFSGPCSIAINPTASITFVPGPERHLNGMAYAATVLCSNLCMAT